MQEEANDVDKLTQALVVSALALYFKVHPHSVFLIYNVNIGVHRGRTSRVRWATW